MAELQEGLRWMRPELLWLFLPWAALLIWRLRVKASVGAEPSGGGESGRGGSAAWDGVIDPALLPHLLNRAPLSDRLAPKGRLISTGSAWLVLLGALILALAGPQVMRPGSGAAEPLLRPDATRVLVIELLPEFDALPEAVRQKAKTNLRRFVRALPRGETALMVVAGGAWLVVPPTEDVRTLDGFINELSAAAVPVQGYRPDAGLMLANAILNDAGSRSKSIFWLQVKTPSRSVNPFPSPAPGGVSPIFLQVMADGASASAVSKTGAQNTGVAAVPEFADDVALWLAAANAVTPTPNWIASTLNLGEPTTGWTDLGPYLVLLVLPLAAWLAWPAKRSTWMVLLLVFGLGAGNEEVLAEAPGQVDEVTHRGAALYRAGRFADAVAAFSQLPKSDARAHYNRGNALARSGRLQPALDAYDESLRLRPDDADTEHNRQLVARLLQSPKDPPPKPPQAPPPPAAPQRAEAERAAAQWLRRPPADAAGLLQRKLALEEARQNRKPAP